MEELEKMQRAKMYLDKLAEGIDPITDTTVPMDSLLNNVRLSRCFYYVSDILRQVIENGGQIGAKPTSRRDRGALPFALTEVQIKQVELSDTPIPISVFADKINAVIDTEQMKKLSAIKVTQWLLKEGYLVEVESSSGHQTKTLTEKSAGIGITNFQKTSTYGQTYFVNLYSRKAQQFILDNLENIVASANDASKKSV